MRRCRPLAALASTVAITALTIALLTASVGPVIVLAPEAQAVPTYARRYDTSCVTCHIAFPRLNSFGEAFRRAGYRFPDDNLDFVAEEPLVLGHEAYTNVFPEAVWPSDMPFVPPVSLVTQAGVSVRRNADTGDLQLSLSELEAAGELYVATGFGDDLSVFGRFGLGGVQSASWHQRLFFTINDLLPDTTIRVGDFHPEVFQRERDCNSCHFALSRPVGDNSWGWIGDIGLEVATTTLDGRLRLVAGVLDGNRNVTNGDVDVYGRVGTKIGGRRLDGHAQANAVTDREAWVDNSLELGVFGYLGNATLRTVDSEGAAIEVDDRFRAFGTDFFFTWSDFGLYGAAIFESHDRPTGVDRDIGVDRFLLRTRYVVFPWLVPEVSFEYFNTGLPTDMAFQIQPTVDFLLRANIKISAQAFLLRDVRSPLAFESARLTIDFGL